MCIVVDLGGFHNDAMVVSLLIMNMNPLTYLRLPENLELFYHLWGVD